METLRIDFTSDFICPWCRIGYRNLRQAIAQAGVVDVEVAYLPFELNPDMPAGGVRRVEYRVAKFGSLARSQALDAQVVEAGRAAGLSFDFSRVERTPGTRLAHRAMVHAQSHGDPSRTDRLFEALLDAYFVAGLDLGDVDVLATLAAASGFDGDALRRFLSGSDGEREVLAAEAEGRQRQVRAVPAIRIGDLQVSGAQPVSTFVQLIREASTAAVASS